MGHSLARHSVESLFHMSSLYFYTAAFLLGDVFIIPQLKAMYDNRKRFDIEMISIIYSTVCEYEADRIGMYLMKRAGYSTEGYINTISSLPSTSGIRINKTVASFFLTHPEPVNRREALEASLPQLEEEFKTKYTIEQTTAAQKMSYFMSSVQTTWAWLLSAFC